METSLPTPILPGSMLIYQRVETGDFSLGMEWEIFWWEDDWKSGTDLL